MTRTDLVEMIYKDDGDRSCVTRSDYVCGDCMECCSNQLAEYEQKIIKAAVNYYADRVLQTLSEKHYKHSPTVLKTVAKVLDNEKRYIYGGY